MHALLRFLPYTLALVGTVLAAIFLWVVPSMETSLGTFEPRGEERHATMTCRAGGSWSFDWDTVLEGPSESMTPLMPHAVRARSGEASGVCEASLDIRVFADGEEVYRAVAGYILENEHEGSYRSGSVVPDRHSDLENWPDTNRLPVRITVLFTVKVTEPGTGSFEAEVGPLTVRHAPLDSDHDGVEDRSQVVPFHSGLATLLVAVVLTGLAVLWSRRMKKADP